MWDLLTARKQFGNWKPARLFGANDSIRTSLYWERDAGASQSASTFNSLPKWNIRTILTVNQSSWASELLCAFPRRLFDLIL